MVSSNVAIGLVAMALLFSGCQKGEKDQEQAVSESRILEIVQTLRSGDAGVRQRAVDRLKAAASDGLTIEEGTEAIRAAAEKWPAGEKIDASDELVNAALSRQHTSYIKEVSEHFPRYSEMARWRVVRYLISVCNEAAARAYLDLIRQHQNLVPPASIQEFTQSAEATKLLLPDLLKYAGADELGSQIQMFALRAAQLGVVAETDLAPYAEPILRIYTPMRDRMRKIEKPAGDDWIWTDEYSDTRAHATLLLDLMGHLPGNVTKGPLEEALSSRDPRVKLFAILSLLRHGYEVRPAVIEDVAASSEVRNWLYDGLVSLNRRKLYPPRFASQDALAESNMVNWLTYPAELGRTPHEIKLMATFDDDAGQQRHYLFRFRTHPPHWAAEDGWMAGLSGPFEIATMPTTNAGGSTFSKFTKWDNKTPKEHFEAISGLIAKHWKKRAAEITNEAGE